MSYSTELSYTKQRAHKTRAQNTHAHTAQGSAAQRSFCVIATASAYTPSQPPARLWLSGISATAYVGIARHQISRPPVAGTFFLPLAYATVYRFRNPPSLQPRQQLPLPSDTEISTEKTAVCIEKSYPRNRMVCVKNTQRTARPPLRARAHTSAKDKRQSTCGRGHASFPRRQSSVRRSPGPTCERLQNPKKFSVSISRDHPPCTLFAISVS